jgi:hypothetical protein
MHRLMLVAVLLLDETRAFHEGAQIVQCNPAIYLKQSPFDDMLELSRVQRAGASHRQ